MAGKGNSYESDILKLLFTATSITNIAQDGVTPLTNLYVSLHTSDPGETGNQTTNEASFTGYARVAVARTSGGWTESSGTVTNASAVTFAPCSGGSSTVTHFGVGTVASSGTGKLLYFGALGSPLSITSGVTASFAIGDISISED